MSPRLALVISVVALLAAPPTAARADPFADSYLDHARINVEHDADFCVPDGHGGWRDNGVLNCGSPGAGNASNPYLIAGWHIDAAGGYAIRLRNTTRWVTLEHNWLDNSLKGVTLNADGVFYLPDCPLGAAPGVSPECVTWPRLVVANNTIRDMTAGVRAFLPSWRGGPYLAGEAIHLADNEISGSAFFGAVIAIPGTVEHNRFSDDSVALAFGDVPGVDGWRVERNVFRGNGDGIDFVESTGPALEVLIDDNDFSANSGVALSRDLAPVLAPDNWWGDAAGPAYLTPNGLHVGGGPDSETVEGTVVAAPWLAAPPPDVGPR